jgi:hypothetical protein
MDDEGWTMNDERSCVPLTLPVLPRASDVLALTLGRSAGLGDYGTVTKAELSPDGRIAVIEVCCCGIGVVKDGKLFSTLPISGGVSSPVFCVE